MPTITVHHDAPVITTTRAGRRFPADYGRLADCWDLTWAALSGGEWVAGLELARRMAQHGDVAHDTAENLLRAGRKYGLLEVRHRLYGTPRRWRAEYRATGRRPRRVARRLGDFHPSKAVAR